MTEITCPYCGATMERREMPGQEVKCAACGKPLNTKGEAVPAVNEKDGSSSVSGKAVASLVCSIVGLLTCPFAGNILGIIFGRQARREIRESGGGKGGGEIATAGIALGWAGIGLHLYIMLIIGVMIFALTYPALQTAIDQANRAKCANNVKQLTILCRMYAEDYDGRFPPGFEALNEAGFYVENLTSCPTAGGAADYGLNAAAAPDSPPETPFIGDFDSFNHSCRGGNIGLLDGSVIWHPGSYKAGTGPLYNIPPEDWGRE